MAIHCGGAFVDLKTPLRKRKSRIKKWIIGIFFLGILLGFVLPAAAEGASIVKIGGDVTVEEGMTVHYAAAIGGQVTIKGTVERHVVAIGGSVVLAKTAVVGGNIIAVGGVIVRGSGAEVAGSMTEIDSSDITGMLERALNEDWEGWSWIFALVSLFFFICILMLAFIIVILIPRPVRVIAAAIKDNTIRVVVWGISGLVLIAPLAVLLAVSVVGIILIPLEMTLVAFAVLVGFIAVAQIVGKKLMTLVGKQDQSMMRETMWGLAVLWLVGWIPYLGWLIKACAIVVGLGAVLLTRFGTNEHY